MTADSTPRTLHDETVPDSDEFGEQRSGWRRDMGSDQALRTQAVRLQADADRHHYTYQWEWGGVPVIRLPDDIVVLQELIWAYRPTAIVETGIARGGSMILNASLQLMAGLEPHVLGIDISIFPHTRRALSEHPLAAGVELLETGSTTDTAVARAAAFLRGHERCLLILDSDHTHAHVLSELRLLSPLLPPGSFVLVADTLIEEFPEGFYTNRSWDRGNNPATAVREFLAENDHFAPATPWTRRALLTEFRDGILQRLN